MIDIDRIKENHKEFIKSNKSALKAKQLKLKEVIILLKKFIRLL